MVPTLANGHCPFAVDDVPPRLLQLFWPDSWHRAVVVPEDRGVELRVLDIGADDAACVRIDQQATEEHARAFRQVVFERGKATIPIASPSKPPPDFQVAPNELLLFVAES